MRGRCTFPVGVRGIVSTTWMTLGTLNAASFSEQYAISSDSVVSPLGTTAAPTSCPYFLVRDPVADGLAHARMGLQHRLDLEGEMFSPPRMMISLSRP